ESNPALPHIRGCRPGKKRGKDAIVVFRYSVLLLLHFCYSPTSNPAVCTCFCATDKNTGIRITPNDLPSAKTVWFQLNCHIMLFLSQTLSKMMRETVLHFDLFVPEPLPSWCIQ